MSRYRGNDERCPHCNMRYRDLRTGLSYNEVFELLMDYSEDSADWSYKRRHTVLGKWHQIKREQWDYHINRNGCPETPLNIAPQSEPLESNYDEVPF